MRTRVPKRCFYTIATGQFVELAKGLENSLRKFDQTTPFITFGEGQVQMARDPQIFYRAAPYFAKKLFDEGYDEVCKLDADQVILGDLSHIWEGDYDAATVLNDPTYTLQVWDITPYYNNGLVVLKNKEFVDRWLKLCYSAHFEHYQFREQDLLNILCSDYYTYKVRNLDDGSKFHGECIKIAWPKTYLKDGQVLLDGKQVLVYHAGGGHQGNKMDYRLRFPEEVARHIEGLTK